MTVDEALYRPHPIAMKAGGHPMAQLHQCDRAGVDISGIEYRKVAAVFTRAPDRGEQPAVALRGVMAAGDEYRFRDRIAGRQQIVAEPRPLAVDMHQAGKGGG